MTEQESFGLGKTLGLLTPSRRDWTGDARGIMCGNRQVGASTIQWFSALRRHKGAIVKINSWLSVMSVIAILTASTASAQVPSAQVLCPNGSYVSPGPCVLCPDGSFIGGGGKCQLAPNGRFVPETRQGPQMAPDGSFVGGNRGTTMCADGSYVAGTRCVLTPSGTFVGQ